MNEIAILGWGSLIWDEGKNKKFSQHHDGWQPGGPRLKIEFSRISGDGRLTLVIDKMHGQEVQVCWAFSTRSTIEEAVCDLRRREGIPEGEAAKRNIGRWPAEDGGNSGRYPADRIQAWAQEKEIGGVVWTALPSYFKCEDNKPFSVVNAISYLNGLKGCARQKALEYIRRAPPCVDTLVRRAFNESGMPMNHPDETECIRAGNSG